MAYDEIILELARMEREARAAVVAKLAARQLGEAWEGLEDETEFKVAA